MGTNVLRAGNTTWKMVNIKLSSFENVKKDLKFVLMLAIKLVWLCTLADEQVGEINFYLRNGNVKTFLWKHA